MGAKVRGWSMYQSSFHKSYIPLTPFLQKKTNFSWYNLWSFRFETLSFDIKVCSHLVFQLHQYGATHSLNPEIFHHRMPKYLIALRRGILFFSLLTFGLKSQSTFYKCGLIHYRLLRILFFWLNGVMNDLILRLPNSLRKFINLKTKETEQKIQPLRVLTIVLYLPDVWVLPSAPAASPEPPAICTCQDGCPGTVAMCPEKIGWSEPSPCHQMAPSLSPLPSPPNLMALPPAKLKYKQSIITFVTCKELYYNRVFFWGVIFFGKILKCSKFAHKENKVNSKWISEDGLDIVQKKT